jgi:hypothetical protein
MELEESVRDLELSRMDGTPHIKNLDEVNEIDIFVSYRVRPDEKLAGELRILLETSIEPKPRVFVSGLGGLRASADSYREQLRHAATNAKTYVGLITKASADREWIFFEAGAAFGRGVLYAPILINISGSDLPSSIGGYQGAMANDPSCMQNFVEDIAKAIGARAKLQFEKRYHRFAKAVESYGKPEPVQELSGIPLAISLLELGRIEEGEKLFDELAGAADSLEAKADIRITKLFFLKNDVDNQGMLELLETQPDEVKSTAIFKLWLGVHETNPIRAIQILREAYADTLDGFRRQLALNKLVQNEFEMGHTREATKRLLEAFSCEDRHQRSNAAAQLADYLGDNNPILKLLLLVEATLEPTFDHFLDTVDFCWQQSYVAVGLHMAWKCLPQQENEQSYLYRGLLREKAGLRSLAFEDWRGAAQYGSSVAKSNMANALNVGSVAAAGLEILRDHVGDYNSSDPGFPYAIRADLERSLAKERKDEADLRSYGDQIVKSIHRLFEGWRHLKGSVPLTDGRWQALGNIGTLQLTVTEGNITIELDKAVLTLQQILPFNGFYVAFNSGEVCLLFVIHNEVEIVALNGMSKLGNVEWLELLPLDKSAPLMLEASEEDVDSQEYNGLDPR